MKRLLSIILMVALSQSIIACDICGCGVGSYYIGILPQFRKKFIGLRYQYKTLQSHISPSGNISYLTNTEHFNTLELWGAVNIGNRFRVMGFVPLNIIKRQNQGNTTSITGLGDVAVIGYYRLFDNKKTIADKLLVHSLWMGAGIKAPTGKYNNQEKSIAENTQNTFQLGTGSTDFILNTMYDIRLQDAGFNTNISYKINTTNSDGYRYGNKLTANFLGYYKIKTGHKTNLAPNTGLMWENAAKDTKSTKTTVAESGGSSLVWTAGIEISLNKIIIGTNFQIPVSQQLANGTVKAGNRVMVHVSYSF